MLKISMRNCTLKSSEIRLMWLFLNTEKSRLVIPGPMRMLRPELPRRLKHCGKEARTGGVPEGFWALGGAGSQFAFQKFVSGAEGTEKHCVLMYVAELPGFVSVWHPDPRRRSGNAKSSLLSVPAGSEPVPQVGVKGTPSLTVRIRPSSQPSVAHLPGPEKAFVVGMSHMPLTTSVRPTLKSESPRVKRRSNQSRREIELPKASPATVAELVSMLFPQVNRPCI